MSPAEIYALCCPDTGEVRYIGKANNAVQRYRTHMRDARRRKTPVYCWINSMLKDCKAPVLRVLLLSDDWRADERRLIAQHRADGARLLNLAEGGDEPFCPPEVRAANGRKVAATRRDPASRSEMEQRITRIRYRVRDILRCKFLSEDFKEGFREKLREASRRRPDLWQWDNL